MLRNGNILRSLDFGFWSLLSPEEKLDQVSRSFKAKDQRPKTEDLAALFTSHFPGFHAKLRKLSKQLKSYPNPLPEATPCFKESFVPRV